VMSNLAKRLFPPLGKLSPPPKKSLTVSPLQICLVLQFSSADFRSWEASPNPFSCESAAQRLFFPYPQIGLKNFSRLTFFARPLLTSAIENAFSFPFLLFLLQSWSAYVILVFRYWHGNWTLFSQFFMRAATLASSSIDIETLPAASLDLIPR